MSYWSADALRLGGPVKPGHDKGLEASASASASQARGRTTARRGEFGATQSRGDGRSPVPDFPAGAAGLKAPASRRTRAPSQYPVPAASAVRREYWPG